MKDSTQKALLAGVPIAAFALFAAGHVLALEWVGRKLREYIKTA